MCSICEAKVELGGREQIRIYEVPPINPARQKDYTKVNKLYLANREIDKLFNEDRKIRMGAL